MTYAFLLAGVVLLIVAGLVYQQTGNFVANAIPARGIVIDSHERRVENTPIYAPVVDFTDREGHVHIFRSGISSYPEPYDVGEVVVVLYLADSPEKSARINNAVLAWGGAGAIGTGAVGVLVFFAGLLMLLFGMRRNRQESQ